MSLSHPQHSLAHRAVSTLQWISLTVVGIAVLAVLAVLGSETLHMMPDHAVILVDDDSRTYHGLPNANMCGSELARLTTFGKAKELGYEPCHVCRDDGLFVGRTCSTVRSLAEDHVGFPRGQDRWNEDGSWNW